LKKYFTIGEIAKIYGISVHSIRHYHKINLIVPSYIDEETGYRYYSFEKFQYFSRLKYLRSLGLSLDQIKEVFLSGSSYDFKKILNEVKKNKEKEILKITETINKIDWIDSYYSFLDDNYLNIGVYKKHFSERYIFQSYCSPTDTLEDMDINLHKKINSNEYKKLDYLRQFGYILKYDSLIEGLFNPIAATILIDGNPAIKSENIKILPEGNYLCYCTHILSPYFNIEPLTEFIKKNNLENPKLVIALEYEDNLKEFYNAIYEIQVLF
jgi:DNA-binding transcriptional MerR regulator